MKASCSLASQTSSEAPARNIADVQATLFRAHFIWFFNFSVWEWADNQAGPGSRGWPRGWTVQDFAGETVSFIKNMDVLSYNSVG